MLFLTVTLYFLLACLVAGLVFFPTSRATAAHALSQTGTQIRKRFNVIKNQRINTLESLRNSALAPALHTGQHLIKQHYWLLLAGAALLCLPPLLAWLMSDKTMLSGFDVSTRDVNVQVAGLLQGEQLVPPMPLPPTVFTTQEILQTRPLLSGASRDWQLLNHDFTQRLLLIFKIMKEKHGYNMVLLEGYRSPERQDRLAQQKINVTDAAAFKSYHQYGLAADAAFLRDGKLVISEKDAWAMRGYQLYGEVAESVGMQWGGRWKIMDLGHAELRVPGVIKQ